MHHVQFVLTRVEYPENIVLGTVETPPEPGPDDGRVQFGASLW